MKAEHGVFWRRPSEVVCICGAVLPTCERTAAEALRAHIVRVSRYHYVASIGTWFRITASALRSVDVTPLGELLIDGDDVHVEAAS